MQTVALGLSKKRAESFSSEEGSERELSPAHRGALADCLSQTSKIASECNAILRDLLRGRSPLTQDLQRLATQQSTLAGLLRLLQPLASDASAPPHPPPSCLTSPPYGSSTVRSWDAEEGGARPVPGASRAQGRRGKGLHPPPPTLQERCRSVQSYWESLSPQERRGVLRVPVSRMLAAARRRGGEDAVRELWEALALLKLSEGVSAAYWACPLCGVRLADAASFEEHLRLSHEGVQSDAESGAPLTCCHCGQQVVGSSWMLRGPGGPGGREEADAAEACACSSPSSPHSPSDRQQALCVSCAWEGAVPRSPDGTTLLPDPEHFRLRLPRLQREEESRGDGMGGGSPALGPPVTVISAVEDPTRALKNDLSQLSHLSQSKDAPSHDLSLLHDLSPLHDASPLNDLSPHQALGFAPAPAPAPPAPPGLLDLSVATGAIAPLILAFLHHLSAGKDARPFETALVSVARQSAHLLAAGEEEGEEEGREEEGREEPRGGLSSAHSPTPGPSNSDPSPDPASTSAARAQLARVFAHPDLSDAQRAQLLPHAVRLLPPEELQALVRALVERHGPMVAAAWHAAKARAAARVSGGSRKGEVLGSEEASEEEEEESEEESEEEEESEGEDEPPCPCLFLPTGVGESGGELLGSLASLEGASGASENSGAAGDSGAAAAPPSTPPLDAWALAPPGTVSTEAALRVLGATGALDAVQAAPWWLSHLADRQASEALPADGASRRPQAGPDFVLRWVYGNVVSQAAALREARWARRQQGDPGAPGPTSPGPGFAEERAARAAALAQVVGEIAAMSRHVAATAEHRRRLAELHAAAAAAAAALAAVPRVVAQGVRRATVDFFHALGGGGDPQSGYCTDASSGEESWEDEEVGEEEYASEGDQGEDARPAVWGPLSGLWGFWRHVWSQAGEESQSICAAPACAHARCACCARAPRLPPPPLPSLDETLPARLTRALSCAPALSSRAAGAWALLLLRHEAAALQLALAVGGQEAEAARREAAGMEASLAAAREESAAADAAHAAAAAEGPSPPQHRRRDALDRLQREAERRERVAARAAAAAAARDRLAAEQRFWAAARRREAEALAEVEDAGEELAVLGTLQEAVEGGWLQQGWEEGEVVDEKGRAVVDVSSSSSSISPPPYPWQLRAAAVAECIARLAPRHVPGTEAARGERHARNVGVAASLVLECDEHRAAWLEDLQRARRRALAIARVDLAPVLERAALEAVRDRLEEGSSARREEAARELLLQLEEEEGARGKKGRKKQGRAKEGKDGKEGKEKDKDGVLAPSIPADAAPAPPSPSQERRLRARQAQEEAYEAALEARRAELERLAAAAAVAADAAARSASHAAAHPAGLSAPSPPAGRASLPAPVPAARVSKAAASRAAATRQAAAEAPAAAPANKPAEARERAALGKPARPVKAGPAAKASPAAKAKAPVASSSRTPGKELSWAGPPKAARLGLVSAPMFARSGLSEPSSPGGGRPRSQPGSASANALGSPTSKGKEADARLAHLPAFLSPPPSSSTFPLQPSISPSPPPPAGLSPWGIAAVPNAAEALVPEPRPQARPWSDAPRRPLETGPSALDPQVPWVKPVHPQLADWLGSVDDDAHSLLPSALLSSLEDLGLGGGAVSELGVRSIPSPADLRPGREPSSLGALLPEVGAPGWDVLGFAEGGSALSPVQRQLPARSQHHTGLWQGAGQTSRLWE